MNIYFQVYRAMIRAITIIQRPMAMALCHLSGTFGSRGCDDFIPNVTPTYPGNDTEQNLMSPAFQ